MAPENRAGVRRLPDHALIFEVITDGRVDAVILPPDLPVTDLRGALDHLRGLGGQGDLTFLAAGLRPDSEICQELGHAGVRFGLWDPIDSHTLRFLVNYALSPPEYAARERSTLRAPIDWRVRVRTAQREKDARLYSLSSNGSAANPARSSSVRGMTSS